MPVGSRGESRFCRIAFPKQCCGSGLDWLGPPGSSKAGTRRIGGPAASRNGACPLPGNGQKLCLIVSNLAGFFLRSDRYNQFSEFPLTGGRTSKDVFILRLFSYRKGRRRENALLAQLVERIHGKDEVTSSSLVEGSEP